MRIYHAEPVAVNRMSLRVRAAQKTGSDLYCACAEDQCGCDASAVGDSTGCDHRHGDGVGYLRNERDQANHLQLRVRCAEGATMSSGFHALRDDCVRARGCCCAGFMHGCRSGKPEDAMSLHFGDRWRRKKSHDWRDGLWLCSYDCMALCLEVGQYGFAHFGGDGRAP